ncbi:hypothetical protein TSOC_003591 [Tetrabaena socialis]|uniref:Uncharacterized protein n=1 Tax=Tetrabaena socialis TaxID=47790 RepID=A0A2J8AB94_9CHLO|nr:hypothetical protein TSOC_003591 [Tetrabaena socialis]|eukprot:PNH09777.1 hypothetical protein TSOC_003591 [Tetrabaena socialis]
MATSQCSFESRLQHLEEANATLRSELEHVRSCTSSAESWQKKVDTAGQQIAAILALVDSRNLALESRLETVERGRAGAHAWDEHAKVPEGLAAQLIALQQRMLAAENDLDQLKMRSGSDVGARSAPAAARAAPKLAGGAFQDELQALRERMARIESATDSSIGGGGLGCGCSKLSLHHPQPPCAFSSAPSSLGTSPRALNLATAEDDMASPRSGQANLRGRLSTMGAASNCSSGGSHVRDAAASPVMWFNMYAALPRPASSSCGAPQAIQGPYGCMASPQPTEGASGQHGILLYSSGARPEASPSPRYGATLDSTLSSGAAEASSGTRRSELLRSLPGTPPESTFSLGAEAAAGNCAAACLRAPAAACVSPSPQARRTTGSSELLADPSVDAAINPGPQSPAGASPPVESFFVAAAVGGNQKLGGGTHQRLAGGTGRRAGVSYEPACCSATVSARRTQDCRQHQDQSLKPVVSSDHSPSTHQRARADACSMHSQRADKEALRMKSSAGSGDQGGFAAAPQSGPRGRKAILGVRRFAEAHMAYFVFGRVVLRIPVSPNITTIAT